MQLVDQIFLNIFVGKRTSHFAKDIFIRIYIVIWYWLRLMKYTAVKMNIYSYLSIISTTVGKGPLEEME